MKKDEDVLEIGVVGEVSHADAWEWSEDVFEGIHVDGCHLHGIVSVGMTVSVSVA